MIFTDAESEYLQGHDLGRLATVQPDGTLQNSPVGFDFDPATHAIVIHGYGLARSRKYRNIAANGQMAFVVDDRPSTDPMRVRCLEIRGDAEAVPGGGRTDDGQDGAYIRLRPTRIVAFGIEDADRDKAPHELRVAARPVGPQQP